MSLELKNNPTLKDFQQYVLQMKRERGFNRQILRMLPAGGRMRGSHFRRAQKFKIRQRRFGLRCRERRRRTGRRVHLRLLACQHARNRSGTGFSRKRGKKQTPHLEKALKTQTPAGIFKPNRQRHRNFRPHVFPLFF